MGNDAPSARQSDKIKIEKGANNVYVVEDDPASRELLIDLFRSANFNVKTYPSGNAFLDDLPKATTGCIVLDVRMPGMNGFEVQAELTRRSLRLPVIFVTAHGATRMAVRAMKAGAHDFVEKPIDTAEMLEIVRDALSRSAESAAARAKKEEIQDRVDQLTPRERDVLDLIAEGELNKQIAHRLGIAQRTVEVHRANIMEKMGAKSAAALIRMVMTVDGFRDS
jgi:RNA polymerase sigma factor (sigma-70 family)